MTDDLPGFRLSQRAARTSQQPINYLMGQALDNPDLISLAAGLVDQQTLPAEATRHLAVNLLDPARGPAGLAALQYGTTAGLFPLRLRLLEHLARLDGIRPEDYDASPDDMVLTTGSQQLLHLLTDVLVDPGDIVITAWPSYFVYTGLLESAGACVRCVDMDQHGMIPEALDRLLAEVAGRGDLRRVKIVYVCDYHQNPTGLTLSAERRPRLLDIVRRYSAEHRILLLEDAAYRELTYEGQSPPSIKRWDAGNRHVALCCTFSKPFAPGVRTGYGLLPRGLADPVALQKSNQDFGSNNLSQHLVLEAMNRGVYDRHVRELCRVYAAKRDAMLAALEQCLGDIAPGRITWTRPTGGLYVYLTLPPSLDTGRHGALFSRAIAEGVLYVPAEYCYGPDATRTVPRNAMRLSFGLASVPQIEQGIERLARAIRASLPA